MVPHPPLDPDQGLVQIASVETVRTGCAVVEPFRQQAVAHRPQAQPGVPERERHARAEQGLPTSASAEGEIPGQEQARTQDAPPWRKR
jgi:hypothetical protein